MWSLSSKRQTHRDKRFCTNADHILTIILSSSGYGIRLDGMQACILVHSPDGSLNFPYWYGWHSAQIFDLNWKLISPNVHSDNHHRLPHSLQFCLCKVDGSWYDWRCHCKSYFKLIGLDHEPCFDKQNRGTRWSPGGQIYRSWSLPRCWRIPLNWFTELNDHLAWLDLLWGFFTYGRRHLGKWPSRQHHSDESTSLDFPDWIWTLAIYVCFSREGYWKRKCSGS